MSLPAPRFRAILLAGVAAGLTLVLPVQTTLPAQASDTQLASRLRSVLAKPLPSRNHTGAVVLDARTGKLIYAKYGSTGRMPASNTKIVTAVSAMHNLGPDFRFHTDVLRRAEVSGGVLHGRLYLKGYGDPTTRVSDFAALAAHVKAAGITRVTGRLIVDSSYFDAHRYNPGWRTGYASDYYAAQISALTVSPNADLDAGTVFVNYHPGARGHHATITTTPAAAKAYVKIVNHTTTSARGSSGSFSAHRRYGSNTITVSGRVPLGRTTRSWQITVDKPELYAGAVFRRELAKLGISVAGRTSIMATPAGKQQLIGRDRSMTLANLLVPFLKLSNNMHAEALTKTMGRVDGRPGTWKAGLARTTGYLRDLGVPMTGVSLTDGSGLTRLNHLTPRALATTLVKVRQEDWWPAFYRALPIAGNPHRMVGGTLRYRMTGRATRDNVHAKTGSLTGVTALSGYVRDRNGRLYAFSLLSNYSGATPRPAENDFVTALAKWKG